MDKERALASDEQGSPRNRPRMAPSDAIGPHLLKPVRPRPAAAGPGWAASRPYRAPHFLAAAEAQWREQAERCRTLVAKIDEMAQQTGGYKAQQDWLNDHATGPVFDASHPTRAEDITPEFLRPIPERSMIFNGSWLEGTGMNAAGKAIWFLLKQNFDNSHVGSENFCDRAAALAGHFPWRKKVHGLYIKGTPRVWSG